MGDQEEKERNDFLAVSLLSALPPLCLTALNLLLLLYEALLDVPRQDKAQSHFISITSTPFMLLMRTNYCIKCYLLVWIHNLAVVLQEKNFVQAFLISSAQHRHLWIFNEQLRNGGIKDKLMTLLSLLDRKTHSVRLQRISLPSSLPPHFPSSFLFILLPSTTKPILVFT